VSLEFYGNARSLEYDFIVSAGADVLIESFRPGVMTRLGVGYAVLKTINPSLVYCSLNGFGYQGPLAEMPAHDVNYLAFVESDVQFITPSVQSVEPRANSE
jgi:hypothetical protein